MLNTHYASSYANRFAARQQAPSQPLFSGIKEDIARAEQKCREENIDLEFIKDTLEVKERPVTKESIRKQRSDDPVIRRREQNRLTQERKRDRDKAYFQTLLYASKNPSRFQARPETAGESSHNPFSSGRHNPAIPKPYRLLAPKPEPGSDQDAPFEWDYAALQAQQEMNQREASAYHAPQHQHGEPSLLLTQPMDRSWLDATVARLGENHQQSPQAGHSHTGQAISHRPTFNHHNESHHNPFSMGASSRDNLNHSMQSEDEWINQYISGDWER